LARNPLDSAISFDSSVDYLTATTSEQKANDFVEHYTSALLSEERRCGNDISHWFLADYSGLSCGSVQFGTNGNSRLVRLSGQAAREHWRTIAEVASNVSRIDWQTTVELSVAQHGVAEFFERKANQFETRHNHGRMVELRRNSKKGKTLYVGSRKSDRFIRVYDKGAESKLGPAGFLWRAELELHRALARAAASRILASDDEQYVIAASISSELMRIGMPWKKFGVGSVLKSSSVRRRCDFDNKLTWLNSQVRGTVQYLIENGREEEVLKALGLAHVGQAHRKGTDGNL
jgi:DNA relaxase NicK